MFHKRQTLALLSTMLVSSGLAHAADKAMDHSKMSSPAASTGQPAAPNMQQMAQMQQQMFKMHELMHQIQAEKDPAKRQKLQQEHLRLMQEHMQGMMPMMMSMMQGGKMSPGMQGGTDNMEGMDMGDGHQPAGTSPKK